MAVPEPDVRADGQAVDRGDAVRSVAAAVFLAVFAFGATYMAFSFGTEARRLPLVVGFPLSVMAIINLVVTVRDARRTASDRRSQPAVRETNEPADSTADGAPAVDEVIERARTVDGDDTEQRAEAIRAAQAAVTTFEDTGEGLSFRASLAAVAVVTALFMLLGLIPATVLFTLGYMKLVGRESWLRSVVTTALLILLFWLFRTLLNVRFYQGWLAAEDYIPYLLPF